MTGSTGTLPLQPAPAAQPAPLPEPLPEGTAPWRTARAPYRVSPLGAHVDHQLGSVLGFSLEPAIRLRFRPRIDRRVVARSREFPGEEAFDAAAPGAPCGTWGDYLRGVAVELGKRAPLGVGLDALVEGDLPPGGVSSSASLQVAFLLALSAVNGLVLDRQDAMRLVRDAERAYAGVEVGLLDPAIILFGETGKLVHLDCREEVPRAQRLAKSLPPFSFLLVDSGVPRDLRDGRYNERVAECRAAARALGSTSEPPALRDVTLEVLRRRRTTLDRVSADRAEHVLTENKRVRDGLAALQRGDLTAFCRLVDASADSLATRFEVGTPETLFLLRRLRAVPGVLAATFAGAGFGGQLFAICEPLLAPELASAALAAPYAAAFPDAASRLAVRKAAPGPGAGLVAEAS